MGISRILSVLFVASLASQNLAQAEIRIPLPSNSFPKFQCSFCEISDVASGASCNPRTVSNYCACRSDTQPIDRILVSEKNSQLILEWKQFETKQINALRARLTKRGEKPEVIKIRINKLRKRLRAQFKTLKSQCVKPDEDEGGSGKTFLTINKSSDGLVTSILNSPEQSYVTDVTDNELVLGGTYPLEVSSPTGQNEPRYYTGLTRSQQRTTVIQPFIIRKNDIISACKECTEGLALISVNKNGFAVGEKIVNAITDTSQGIIFDLSKSTLQILPLQSNSSSSGLKKVSDSNVAIGVGTVEMSSPRVDSFVYARNTLTTIDRVLLLNEHLKSYRQYALAKIKQELKNSRDFNECGDQEIEQTFIVGNGIFVTEPGIIAADINNRDEIIGNIVSSGTKWEFAGPCQSGQSTFTSDYSLFTISATGTVTIIPVADINNAQSLNTTFFAATSINNSGTIVGALSQIREGVEIGIGVFNRGSGNAWINRLNVPGYDKHALFPGDINDNGVMVGSYYPLSAPNQSRAFMLRNGKFIDLNTYLPSGSDLSIYTAYAINTCGRIAANAVDQKTQKHTMVIISPEQCPLGGN